MNRLTSLLQTQKRRPLTVSESRERMSLEQLNAIEQQYEAPAAAPRRNSGETFVDRARRFGSMTPAEQRHFESEFSSISTVLRARMSGRSSR
jgi:hypothetical protein